MAGEPLLTALREAVAGGERLRLALLGGPRRTDAAVWGVTAVELAMFYGRAFDRVYREAAGGDPAPGSTASLVRAEALAGLALHQAWMLSDPPSGERERDLGMSSDWERVCGMSRRWMAITVLVGA